MKYGTKPQIVNMVATGQLNTKLNLSDVAVKIDAKNVEYEPETYPGLLLKLKENGAHLTLYTNGKYIILGVKTIEETNKSYEILVKKLKEIGVF
jgi:transcription initiation factor TFIID TATA-box-binding protein